MPVGPVVLLDEGDAICRPYSFSPRAIDLEQLDVDDHLGPRLVDRGNQLAGGSHARGRVLDGDRVGGRHRREPARVDDDAQQVDRFLQVGVAEREGADDLFLVLLSLGRRVGDDGDEAWAGHAVEAARRRRQRLQRVLERGLAQIDRDRLIAELRIERDVDVREPGERGEDVARRRIAEGQRRRQPHVDWAGPDPGRRQVARALDQRLESGLAVAGDGDLVPQLRADRVERVRDVLVIRD